MSDKWTQQDIPDLDGKIVIVTGANSGLGLESTKAFAAKGAIVVMACRNMSKAEQAKAEVLASNPNAKLDVMPLDNASIDSVRAFADAFKAKYARLDILLNNAGVMAIPRTETADGFEMQLGVNHLAHFALTGLLLDVITKTPGARVHNTSSSAAFNGKINFDDLMGKTNYSRWGSLWAEQTGKCRVCHRAKQTTQRGRLRHNRQLVSSRFCNGQFTGKQP